MSLFGFFEKSKHEIVDFDGLAKLTRSTVKIPKGRINR